MRVSAYEGQLHKLLVGQQSSTDLSVEYESPKRKFHYYQNPQISIVKNTDVGIDFKSQAFILAKHIYNTNGTFRFSSTKT
jgi:hypothetical protein